MGVGERTSVGVSVTTAGFGGGVPVWIVNFSGLLNLPDAALAVGLGKSGFVCTGVADLVDAWRVGVDSEVGVLGFKDGLGGLLGFLPGSPPNDLGCSTSPFLAATAFSMVRGWLSANGFNEGLGALGGLSMGVVGSSGLGFGDGVVVGGICFVTNGLAAVCDLTEAFRAC